MSTLQSPQLDYTARDFESLRDALLRMNKIRFPNDWKDISSTGVAMALMENVAWCHAQNAYYYDRSVLNLYMDTADTREFVIALAKQIGYSLRPRTPASVVVRLTPNPVQAVPITIAKGTKLRMADLVFEAVQDYTIPAGKAYWPDSTTDTLVVFTNGETKSDSFISDGGAFQDFNLSSDNVLDRSVVVSILDETWEQVDSLAFIEGDTRGRDSFISDGTDSQIFVLSLLHVVTEPNGTVVVLVNGVKWTQTNIFDGGPFQYQVIQDVDGNTKIRFGISAEGCAPGSGALIDVLYTIAGAQKRYAISFDDNDRPTIHFGDGVQGLVPTNGVTISVAYSTGGGTQGNVPVGGLSGNVSGTLPSGARSNVGVFNYEPGSGGEEPETIDHAKYFAPLYAKSNVRAVTISDWDALAATYRDSEYGAPAHASAKLKQEVPELNTVQVAVWSRDSLGRLSAPGTALKEAIKQYLYTKAMIQTQIEMTDGKIVFFDVDVSVQIKPGLTAAVVFAEIELALQNYFNSTFVLPGSSISISKVYGTISGVAGVQRAVVNSIRGVVTVKDVIYAYTGAQVADQLDIPDGFSILPNSFKATDGTQVVTDDGVQNIQGDVEPTGTNLVTYATGIYNFTFATTPVTGAVINVEAKYAAKLEYVEDLGVSTGVSTLNSQSAFYPIIARKPRGIAVGTAPNGRTVSFTLPDEWMPIAAGRFYFRVVSYINALDPFNTTFLEAYDDGDGNIVGDVDVGGTINYITGEVLFTWNAVVPSATTPGTITVFPAPDDVTTEFTFAPSSAWWPAVGTAPVTRGRIQVDFSALGLVFDNTQGDLHGDEIIPNASSAINYLNGNGVLRFKKPLPTAGGSVFTLTEQPIVWVLYSPFVFSAKNPDAPGYLRYCYINDSLDPLEAYGTLSAAVVFDKVAGRYTIPLTSAVPTGYAQQLSYDAEQSSNDKDIPIDKLSIGTSGQTVLSQLRA